MRVFLRICIFLLVLAVGMVVLTMFEFKDNHISYKKPASVQTTKDNDTNNNNNIKE